jgi:hemerythrin
MPKLLTWRKEWSLGIGVLDADHRALIEALTDICLRYCPQAASHAPFPGRVATPAIALADALATFGEKVRAHCRREEAFMRAIDYDRWSEHAELHVILMTRFDAMVRDCRARGTQVFDEVGQAWVHDWLLGHIIGSDREFAYAYFNLVGLESTCG